MRRSIIVLSLVIGLVAAGWAPPALAAPQAWRPPLAAAIKYAQQRHGEIEFAVRTQKHLWAYHSTRTMPSASVIKAMALVAYLNHRDVRNRSLNSGDLNLIGPMIRRSDDAAASRVVSYIGLWRLRALARRVGMKHFSTRAVGGCASCSRSWGNSRINASDQSRFLLHIDDFTVPRHRAEALKLLSSITSSQRWGIWKSRPNGWMLYAKGGWGLGTGWVDHQVGLLKRGNLRVGIAILQHNTGSHAYGKNTLRALGKLLTRGLDSATVVERRHLGA